MSATHRNEYTGSAPLDRIQANVRDLTTQLNEALARLSVLERTMGTGVVSIGIADIDRVLSGTEFKNSVFIVTGAQTSARKITLPSATSATAYQRWFVNATTGGFGLTISTGSGATVSIPNGSTKCVEATASGARLLT